ncbi:hypothetical protein D3C87_1654520 [compost metagenome]
MAFTLPPHGIATGLPVSRTMMVLGFALATASIIASCPNGSDMSGLSNSSLSCRTAKTIERSDRRAKAAASAGKAPGL